MEARLLRFDWRPHRHAACACGLKRLAAAVRASCWHAIDAAAPTGAAIESLPWLLWGADVLPYVPGGWLEPAAYAAPEGDAAAAAGGSGAKQEKRRRR